MVSIGPYRCAPAHRLLLAPNVHLGLHELHALQGLAQCALRRHPVHRHVVRRAANSTTQPPSVRGPRSGCNSQRTQGHAVRGDDQAYVDLPLCGLGSVPTRVRSLHPHVPRPWWPDPSCVAPTLLQPSISLPGAMRAACPPCHATGDHQSSPSSVTVLHMPKGDDATYACPRHRWRKTYLSIPLKLAHCKRLSRPLVPRADIAKVKQRATPAAPLYSGSAITRSTAGVVWSDRMHPADQQDAVRWCFTCVCFRAAGWPR